MEAELEELAKRFRRAHAERNQSIENWKQTLDVLEDRDKEIMDISSVTKTFLVPFTSSHLNGLNLVMYLNSVQLTYRTTKRQDYK